MALARSYECAKGPEPSVRAPQGQPAGTRGSRSGSVRTAEQRRQRQHFYPLVTLKDSGVSYIPFSYPFARAFFIPLTFLSELLIPRHTLGALFKLYSRDAHIHDAHAHARTRYERSVPVMRRPPYAVFLRTHLTGDSHSRILFSIGASRTKIIYLVVVSLRYGAFHV